MIFKWYYLTRTLIYARQRKYASLKCWHILFTFVCFTTVILNVYDIYSMGLIEPLVDSRFIAQDFKIKKNKVYKLTVVSANGIDPPLIRSICLLKFRLFQIHFFKWWSTQFIGAEDIEYIHTINGLHVTTTRLLRYV